MVKWSRTPQKRREYLDLRFSRGLCRECHQLHLQGKRYCQECLDKSKARLIGLYNSDAARRSRRRLRSLILAHYGYQCQCCGEREEEFLELDHVDGGGTSERRRRGIKAGDQFYRYIRRAGFPKRFQVLCSNCNRAKGRLGVCPHKGL